MFPKFWKKKILVGDESREDYKEVTEAEKVQIEAKAEAYEKWTPALIKQWDVECGEYGRYNPTTGFGELNGLFDITADQAIRILSAGRLPKDYPNSWYRQLEIRTNLVNMAQAGSILNFTFYLNTYLETVIIRTSEIGNWCFKLCARLKSIGSPNTPFYGINIVSNTNCKDVFAGCSNLESVYGYIRYNNNLCFMDSPKINLISLQYLIKHATNTNEITITLHPKAYARLTDDLIAEAAEKQITFAT